MSNREKGLLFHLTCQKGGTAEVAEGDAEPIFYQGVDQIQDPALGGALRVGRENSRFSHRAPGNIYAQRGTLCFFWRSVYPLGPTEFPIYRVSYADHTSWDTAWLRIDYNGWGFDAFVTDCNLSRIRVSYALQPMPKPDVWTHLALSWDESFGLKFYVNGVLVRERETRAVLDAGLDSFGPGGRLISYWGSQNRYNFIREGDLSGLRIYGHMLNDGDIQALAQNRPPVLGDAPPDTARLHEKFLQRFGMDSGTPPLVPGPCASVKKLPIMDPFDHKRLSWKVCDGIRETTWPGVYNRSSLEGRTDYFVLPDWDCYSVSGKRLDFTLPEGTNYLEVTGRAWGRFVKGQETLFLRPKAGERSFHLIEGLGGERIAFENEMKEQPLSDISAFHLDTGCGQLPTPSHRFTLHPDEPASGTEELREFIRRRWPLAERGMLLARPQQTPTPTRSPVEEEGLPFVHIALPFAGMEGVGLDGLLLELPPLPLPSTHGDALLLNISVKDPIWRYRSMLDITLAVRPKQAVTLWMDLRDRVLTDTGCLHVTIACSAASFRRSHLVGAGLHLVTKSREEAKAQHLEDRFMQVRDHFSNMIEERPKSAEFNAYNRFCADLADLLRVDPEHRPGLEYRYLHLGGERPAVEIPACPPDTPQWAFWQARYLHHFKHVVNWWIDHRQIENGEFGGGLSDDGDLTAIWPSLYLLGSGPDKIKESLERQMDAFYDQDMFSSGLCKIQTDQLHTLEDGVQVIGQCLTVSPSDPQHLERAMETARAMWRITGINRAGHRHFTTAYYSGHKLALERPWNFQNSDTLNILHPAYMVLRHNGNGHLKDLILELADSLLAHVKDGKVHSRIVFDTDEDEYVDSGGSGHSAQEDFLFHTAFALTGDEKYHRHVNRRITWRVREESAQLDDDLAAYYKTTLEELLLLEYINTDGQVWSDRVQLIYDKIQQDRLGGIGHIRFDFYPRHYIQWRFAEEGDDERVGIQVVHGERDRVRLRLYNMAETAVQAQITGGEVLPGQWRATRTLADGTSDTRDITFGRERSLDVEFPPKSETWLLLSLTEEEKPLCQRPDLGIGKGDVQVDEDGVTVTVHSLGGEPAPAVPVVLRDPQGQIVARAVTQPLDAPRWLYPVTCQVRLETGHAGPGCRVEIDPEGTLDEISKANNQITI